MHSFIRQSAGIFIQYSIVTHKPNQSLSKVSNGIQRYIKLIVHLIKKVIYNGESSSLLIGVKVADLQLERACILSRDSGAVAFFFSSLSTMPKLTAKQSKKQAASAADARSLGPIFNKDLGQHILKNPLVAQGIVDKVKRQKREIGMA